MPNFGGIIVYHKTLGNSIKFLNQTDPKKLQQILQLRHLQ